MENEILIDGVLVPVELFTIKFMCDITRCGGGCCNADDPKCEGAPLTQAEATLLRRYRSNLAEFIINSFKRKSMARTKPVYTCRHRPPFRVRIDGPRCVYCDDDGCVLKLAHLRHQELPDQPISCALYPICEDWDYRENKPYLYVEHYFDERFCKHGYALGERTGMYLIDFCKEALVRRFGETFFEHLKKAQNDFV